MSHELFYTSAPNGLRPGSSGFCTVAMTAGLSPAIAQRLEMLSGYSQLNLAGEPSADHNPVAWSHWRLSVSGRVISVVSRVCFSGADYSQRTNNFAHHLLLENTELPRGGPAWLLSQPGIMETEWNGPPRVIPVGRAVPLGDQQPSMCSAWADLTGDAAWAGVLASAVASDPSRVAYVIYAPGMEMLPLMREAMALLHPRLRWQIGFSTYFTELPAATNCSWRCCVAGTAAARDADRYAGSGLVLDLTRPLGPAPENSLSNAARTGQLQFSEPAPAPAQQTLKPRPAPAPVRDSRLIALARETPEQSRLPISVAPDQSWMPPVGAGVGTEERNSEPSARVGEHPAKPRMASWILAILWPLLVIPAVVAWHFQTESKEKVDLANVAKQRQTQLQSKEADLAAATQATQDEISRHQNEMKQRDAQLLDKQKEVDDNKKTADQAIEDAKRGAEKTTANLNLEIESLKKQRDIAIEDKKKSEEAQKQTAPSVLPPTAVDATLTPAITSVSAESTATPGTTVNSAISTQPKEIVGIDVTSGRFPLWTDDSSGLTAIEFVSPGATNVWTVERSGKVKLVIRSTATTVPAAGTTATPNPPTVKPSEGQFTGGSEGPVATIELKDGKVWWTPIRIDRFASLRSLLRASGVRLLRDQEVVGTVWLVAPNSIPFFIDSSENNIPLSDLYSEEEQKLGWAAFLHSAWTGKPDGAKITITHRKASDATFSVWFEKRSLKTDYTDRFKDIRNQRDNLRNDSGTANGSGQIKNMESKITELKDRKTNNPSEENQRLNDLKKANEDLKQFRADLKRLNYALDELRTMSKLSLTIQHTETNAAICCIEVQHHGVQK